MSMKNPLTPTGTEPAIYRFVAQKLNHCAPGLSFPHYFIKGIIFEKKEELNTKCVLFF